MEKSKSTHWKVNQKEILNYLKNTNGLSDDEITNFDSKDGITKIRKSFHKEFKNTIKTIMPNSRIASALRGDYIAIRNNIIYLIEAKNYLNARSDMHLPNIYDNATLFKTMDSNIKYPLFYFLNKIDPIFQDLYNCILTKNLTQIFKTYSTPKVVKTITVQQMIHIILLLEIGYAFNEKVTILESKYEISKTKIFVYRDGNKFVFKELDFSSIPLNSEINIEIYVCPKQYTYISFLLTEIENGIESTTCIYSMSMRDITKRKLKKNGKYKNENIANCSFANSRILKTINSSTENLLELLK